MTLLTNIYAHVLYVSREGQEAVPLRPAKEPLWSVALAGYAAAHAVTLGVVLYRTHFCTNQPIGVHETVMDATALLLFG